MFKAQAYLLPVVRRAARRLHRADRQPAGDSTACGRRSICDPLRSRISSEFAIRKLLFTICKLTVSVRPAGIDVDVSADALVAAVLFALLEEAA